MVSNNNWIFSVALYTLCLFFISSCFNADYEPEKQPTQSDFTWEIQLDDWEIANDLKGTRAAVEYNGDVTEIQYTEQPSEGMTFLLVELTIEKQKTGASSFVWENLYVVAENGVKYFRHPNDTFLENYNFPRIKSTNLSIGTNEGYVCFEISKDTAKGSFNLKYESAEGVYQIKIK